MAPEPASTAFVQAVLNWYQSQGRKDLPWQQERSLYRVWVSEVMLQQTQVARVIPYFQGFVAVFPDIQALARADLDQVLHLWSGLGYYSRARNLHKAARIIQQEHGGQFPQGLTEVQALPGLGRSSAGAILSSVLGQPHPILDGNVKRVLCRVFAIPGWPGQAQVQKQLWHLAEQLTPQTQATHYNQAMMDIGAILCIRHKPHCPNCPLRPLCRAHRQNQTKLYPAPRPTKPKPLQQRRFLLITDDKSQLLLEQRPASGIWASLWSLPECTLDRSPEYIEQRFGLKIHSSRELPPLRHSFSHFDLDIFPVHLQVTQSPSEVQEGRWLWYNPNQPQSLGLAAPVQRLLSQHLSTSQEPPHGKNGSMH